MGSGVQVLPLNQRGRFFDQRLRTIGAATLPNLSPDGPLLSIDDLMADFKISRRQITVFIEQKKLRIFRIGKLIRTTQAERDRFVRQLIAEDLEKMEGVK